MVHADMKISKLSHQLKSELSDHLDRLLERGFINSETWRHFFSYGAGAPAFTMTSVRETVGREAGSGGIWLYVCSLLIYVRSGLSSHHFHIIGGWSLTK